MTHRTPRELWDSDRESAWQRADGVWINQARVDRLCEWIEDNVYHRDSAGGTGHLISLVLADWQRDILTNIFGPCNIDTGRRTIRGAVLSMARRNGKTTLADAIAMAYTFGPEAVPASKLAFTATSMKQANETAFGGFRRMTLDHPELSKASASQLKVLQTSLSNIELSIVANSLVAENVGATFGVGYQLVIMDEVGWLRDTELFDVLASSRGDIYEPLLLVISTKTYKGGNPLPDIIRMAQANRSGDWYCADFTLNTGDDPEDESVWAKANPNLGISPSWEDMRAECESRKGNDTLWRQFLATRLNVDVGPEDGLIDMLRWDRQRSRRLRLHDYIRNGRPSYVGIDVSPVNDLTSAAIYFPQSGRKKGALFSVSWLPEGRVTELSSRNLVDYQGMCERGDVRTTKGQVLDLASVLDDLSDMLSDAKVMDVVYDQYHHAALSDALLRSRARFHLSGGISYGYPDVSPCVDAFERALYAAAFLHANNEALDIAAKGVVCSTHLDLRLPVKSPDDRVKVDPVIAAIMAIGTAENALSSPNFDVLKVFN